MKKSIPLLLLSLALVLSAVAHAHVAGRVNVSMLSTGIVSVENTREFPIRCRLRALQDTLHLEIGAYGNYTSKPMKQKVRMHHLSLFCRQIPQVLKPRPWRVNYYANHQHTRHTVFQL